ncbi:hypothetical protein GCM10010413_36720 [Promicromonospora sukumoe]|uniref:Integral membrane protein n=1 Tax=Promicromonospora sukumoe TaxID=88382 RepID=A0A7W3PDB3_9MICO|nr:DUF6112 family protein [Promicromonospora sukumoe]MBA8807613.1 hypothetical protein [Promicromonospora sukumoe]
MLHVQTVTHAASAAATRTAEHATLIAAGIATRVPGDIDIRPNTSGLPGIPQLKEIVGAIMSIGLILAVVALIIAAIVWAFGANSSNPHLAGRGKTGILVAATAGVLCGAAVALVNFGWDLGQQI